jgi:uncharacterized membrane protein YraQ (UPF0718 family)
MKKTLKKYLFDIVIIFAFAAFAVFTYSTDLSVGKKIIEKSFSQFLLEMLSFLPLMFILVGLFDVWIPKSIVEKHIGKDSGFKGSFFVFLLAMLQAGPLYGAFPVAYILWKKGASIRNIFFYLGAFSSLKIPLLAFEIAFLGLKFSLLRAVLSLPVFYAIAVIMEKQLENKRFTIAEPN